MLSSNRPRYLPRVYWWGNGLLCDSRALSSSLFLASCSHFPGSKGPGI